MAWQDVAARVVQGAAGAAGNTNAQAEVGAWQQRKQGLEDEQRQLKQSELDKQAASGAITPVQWGSATSDLYAHEPAESRLGRLKRGAERIVGMKKQADAQKAQADAKLAAQPSPKADYASIQASAKTPDQLAAEKQKQAISTFTQEGDIKNTQTAAADAAKQKATLDLIDKYVTDPEANKAAKQEYVQKQAGILGTMKPIAGPGGQPHRLPDGTIVREVQSTDGGIVQQLMPSDTPLPPQKVPTMKPGTVDGKNAFAYYSMDQKAWIDSNTGQPVKNFVPAPNFSQTGLWGLDTGYDAQGNPVPVMVNRRNAQVIPAPAGIVAPAQSKGIEAQRTAAIAGDSLLRTMIGAADRAKAGDQQAMLSVVANHIGMTLGAQKGARINQAVWNEATESAPLLQNVEKSWGPDGYLQGVKLSPQQVDQMVELGKLRRDIMWQQASQTAQAAGVPLQVPQFQLQFGPAPRAAGGGGQGKKVVSLAKARNLPQYKGKSDAEITAAAKTLGYEVKP